MPKGTIHRADGWMIVHEPTHGVDRLFITTSGGYLDSDTWRLSSSIIGQRVEDCGAIVFTTQSGSEYRCNPGMERRLSVYGYGVINSAIEEGRLVPKDYKEE